MNVLTAFSIELLVTVAAAWLLMAYMGPSLHRILLDLCSTDDRARFWLSFSRLLLIGVPTATALAYQPEPAAPAQLFFDLMRRLGGNLLAFLFALVALGIVLSAFAAIAALSPKGRSA